jgi:hypothetical protein
MFGNISKWFSSKQESSQEDTWNAMTIQTHQPTSPDAPSTDRVVTEQPVRFFFKYNASEISIADMDLTSCRTPSRT